MLNKGLQLIRKFGLDVVRIRDPFAEQLKAIGKAGIIFDIGANVGGYTEKYSNFPNSKVFCFEPCRDTFDKLYERLRNKRNVTPINSALGDKQEEKQLHIYLHSGENSFLEFNQEDTKESQICSIDTVDNFCRENHIEQIDIMKIDVQGYEMQVLKGAKSMLANSMVKLIYVEGQFNPQYKEASTCFDIGKFLLSYGFTSHKLFNLNYKDGVLTHADFMFTLQTKGGRRASPHR